MKDSQKKKIGQSQDIPQGFFYQEQGITPENFDFYEEISDVDSVTQSVKQIRTGFIKGLGGEKNFLEARDDILLLLEATETDLTPEDIQELSTNNNIIMELINTLDDDYDSGIDINDEEE